MFDRLKDGEFCPLIQKACVTHKCKWYKKIRGLNPQTGEMVDEYDCAISMLPLLLIENALQTRQVGVEVSEVRRETIKQTFVMLPQDTPNKLLPVIDNNSLGPNWPTNGD